MKRGYIKVHRKIVDSQVFKNPELLKVWLWCLLRADHKGNWVTVRTGKGVSEVWVGPGQFIYGRESAAKQLSMKASSVRNRIKKLENLKNLTCQADSQYSIITICNWELFQSNENPDRTAQKDRRRTGKGQAKDTDKNSKHNKKEKITAFSENAVSDCDFYLTKKNKKLSGWKLKSFSDFWNAFDFKKGKAEAADAWMEIKSLDDSMVAKILDAAKAEAKRRPEIVLKGHSPKWAQGWLTGRRWEDEQNAVNTQKGDMDPWEKL